MSSPPDLPHDPRSGPAPHPAAALAGADDLFRVMVEQSLVGIYVIQDGILRYGNPRLSTSYPASTIP